MYGFFNMQNLFQKAFEDIDCIIDIIIELTSSFKFVYT